MSREFSLRTNAIVAVLIASCLATFRPALCSQNPSTLSIDSQAELEQLLNPRALTSNIFPATLDDMRSAFADPPADFRPMPLWVWNDELQWPRLREQLAQFKQQGIGGVFIHPRPGLMTEYLSPQWFDLWRQSMEEGRRLGLLVNIYDENSYPSGFSGGHVPALAPDTVSQFVQAESDLRPEDINFAEAELVAVFAVEKSPDGSNQKAQRIRSPADYRAGQALVRFRLRRASGNPWTAGFPYVDLTNPQTAPLFISTTFEPYKSQFGGQFGKTIKWAFDDEPLIATGGAYDSSPLALPLSRTTLAEFQKRCHYDLAEHLPSLYWDVGNYQKVRFDYWQTLHDLWRENYFRPLFQWCDRNQLQFTGHWMEHEWPYPWISPADASFYAYEHVPGIDMLEGGEIRTKGADPHMLFTIKQVASAAHQLGRRAFCEAYGVSGWDSTFEHYKRFGDWLMVHGVNFINPHLAFETVRGARKRDHPQSFSDISPWWPYYRLHGDYLGRVSYMLSQGKAQNRLLILEPTTSGFLWARKGGSTGELAQLRNSYTGMMQFLADHQVDFDLVDEYILEWFGRAADRKLVVGKASYDLLVWPDRMVNLRHETVSLLAKYLEGGGEVVALSAPAEYVDGQTCADVKNLAQRYASQWHSVSGLPHLLSRIRHMLEPRVVLEQDSPHVGLLERFLDNGDRILFLANTGLRPVRSRATVAGGALEQWDPVSGRIEPAPYAPAGNNRLQFPLDLPPAGSGLFVVRRETVAPPPVLKPVQFTPLQAADWRVQPDSANVLVLDYCDLRVAGLDISDINTWRANWQIWQIHGFDRPAWDNAVQFRRRIFDREPFPSDSGFIATFRFQVKDPAVMKGLELALEVPELYQVSLNGQTVSFAGGTRWLDPRIRRTAIGHLARPGENIITVRGRPFDVRMELENVYLLGAFGIVPSTKGFSLGAAPKLTMGSWARQGYSFFSGAVLYETEVIVPDGKKLLRVELGPWTGSLAVISLDGQDTGAIGWPPYSTELPVSPGRHQVGVRVVATPRNLFGPFHNPAKLRMKAWPAAWAEFPEHQPPGSAYDVLDYGLMEPPVLSASSSAMK